MADMFSPPPRIVHNMQSPGYEVIRLNLPFIAIGCCSVPTSAVEPDTIEVPAELKAKGLTNEEWQKRIQKLNEINHTRSSCFFAFCPFLYLSFVFVCFLPLYFRSNKNKVKQWDQSLRTWQDEFNSEILERLDMRVKTKSLAVQAGKSRIIYRWLAFSLTEQDSQALKMEPHLNGVVTVDCEYCCGIQESEFCCHPNNHF